MTASVSRALGPATAALVLAPCLGLGWFALGPSAEPAVPWSLALRGIAASGLLGLLVSVLATALGFVLAYLVTHHRFRGRGLLGTLLVLPLLWPPFVLAQLYAELLSASGPFGDVVARLFAVDLCGEGGFVFCLTLSLFPYPYLLCKLSLEEHGAAPFDFGRSIGLGRWGTLRRVVVPLCLPSLLLGAFLVLAETVGDWATASVLSVRTASVVIRDVWMVYEQPRGAARISLACVAAMLVLVTLASRRLGPLRLRHALGGLGRPTRAPLAATPAVGILALSCCSLPVLLGVVVPLGAVARLFARNLHRTNLSGLRPSCVDSLLLVAAAVAVALVLALAVTYWQHARPGPWARFVGRVAVLGYVLPVMVFALAVLVLARLLLPAERYSDATAFTILAYAIALRMLCFLLVPIGVGLAGLAERFGDLAPTLGLGARGAFRKLQLPYLTRFVGLGLLLVALQSLREVGLTVVLGPFGFEPVATKIYALVRIGLLADSAAWVLALALLGLGPVLVLAGAISKGELGAEGPHAATRRAVAQGR